MRTTTTAAAETITVVERTTSALTILTRHLIRNGKSIHNLLKACLQATTLLLSLFFTFLAWKIRAESASAHAYTHILPSCIVTHVAPRGWLSHTQRVARRHLSGGNEIFKKQLRNVKLPFYINNFH